MENINTSELWEHLIRNDEQFRLDQNNLTEIQLRDKMENDATKFNGKLLQKEAYIYDITTDGVQIIIPGVAPLIRERKKSYEDATIILEYDKTTKDKLLSFSKGDFVKFQGKIRRILTSSHWVFLELISIEKATPPKSSPKSMCYLTTACTDAMQLPDNCYELQTLRKFRDEYVATKPNGKLLIGEYYKTAPKIISAINSTGNGDSIFRNLYSVIKKAVTLIEENKFEEAYQLYCNFANQLRYQYFI